MKIKLILFLLIIFFQFHCGSLENIAADNSNNETDIEDQVSAEEPGSELGPYLFGTDYLSSGQLMQGSLAGLDMLDVTGLGSSAVIRFYEDRLYILHDGFSFGSLDNVQILDPVQNFKTLAQFSTGNGTNPKDIVVDGDLAYITLYSPELSSSADSVDLITMNLQTGAIIPAFDFSAYLNNDGSKTARADQMIRVGSKLYVCIQDLEGPLFQQNSAGKLAVINLETLVIEDVVELKGRNPFTLAYSEAADRLFISHLAYIDYASGEVEIDEPYGGVEILDPKNLRASILLSDNDLGGYVERVVAGLEAVYVVVSNLSAVNFEFSSTILKMPATAIQTDEAEIFIEGSSDIRAMALDSLNRLWVARRKITAGTGQTSSPLVDVIDAETGAILADSMQPIVPIVSIAVP